MYNEYLIVKCPVWECGAESKSECLTNIKLWNIMSKNVELNV